MASITVPDLLAQVRISSVYEALTGKKPRRTGADTWRAPAAWRGGDGFNVSLDDSRGVWHDFVTDEGGGMLDLITRIVGGGRQDALKWVADFAGIHLDDGPLPPEQRQQWAEERRQVERHLSAAKLWQSAVTKLTDELLDSLKAALFDPTLPWPEVGEIYHVEQLLSRLQRLDGGELVEEYTWWATRYPNTTAGLVRTARAREQAKRRALMAFLRESA
jgi:hypothetical protein